MRRKIGAVTILCFISWFLKGQYQVDISFFNNQIDLEYSRIKIPLPSKKGLRKSNIRSYLDRLEYIQNDKLVTSLKQAQTTYNLNDWLLFQLGELAVDTIYQPSELAKTLILYQILKALHFDVCLAYWDANIFIYAASEDQLYKTPFIKIEGRRYYNLTAIQDDKIKDVDNVILFEGSQNHSRYFSFDLSELPNLKPSVMNRTIKFEFEKDSVELDIQFDGNIQNIIAQHPMVEESAYFNIPLSPVLKKSLLPALEKYIEGKSFSDAVKLFTYITRSCFLYAEDEISFGHPKPMAAEEVFFYEKSDCEDRSALFFQLVKTVLDLPIAVIIYPEHVTVGIALPEFTGDYITWNETQYFICDPTGPVNSTVIGKFPQGYKNRPYEILVTHN